MERLGALVIATVIAGCGSDDYPEGQDGSRSVPKGKSYVANDDLDLYDATPPLSPISELGHFTDPDNLEDVGAGIAILAIDESTLANPAPFGVPISGPVPPGLANIVDGSTWGSLRESHVSP